MLIKKNKSKQTISLIFFGLLIISFFSSAIIVINEQYNELDFYGEEKPESTYDRNAFEWKPVGETLINTPYNSESGVGGIETTSYNALTGIETITTPQFTPKPESSAEIMKVEPYAGLLAGDGAEAVTINDRSSQAKTYIPGEL